MSVDTAAKLALAPVLIAQGKRVRKRALILPEAEGPRKGIAGRGPTLRLLITGDSAAAGVGARTQDQALSGQLAALLSQRFTVDWRLEARTGATTASTLKRLNTLKSIRFDVVITSLGVNDITANTPFRKWAAQTAQMHQLLRDRFGAKRILVSGMPPMGHFPLLPHPLRWTLGRTARRFDAHLARYCAGQADCTHMPFDLSFDASMMAEDGFHPSPPAYAEWARRIDAEL